MNRKEVIGIAKDWFDERAWKPAPFQRSCWDAYLSGKHGLLNAPTGSGKTLALWVPIVLDLIQSKRKTGEGLESNLDNTTEILVQ